MSNCVLDASAVLALLFEEPGAEVVERNLPGASICAANHSEVVAKLAKRGATRGDINTLLAGVGATVMPVDASLALSAGMLRVTTAAYGLSLGDRFCLAAALSIGAPAFTTDRAWRELDIGVEVEVIR